jgi:hypothetical protein
MTKAMTKVTCGLWMLTVVLLLTACGNSERRNEINQRRAALIHKQDSSLQAAQQELAIVDSTLEAVKAEYERMKVEVEQHRAQLRATKEELLTLNQLRVYRDSLQVQWNMLGAKIKYIRQKQKEME